MTQKEFGIIFNNLSIAYRYTFIMSVTDSAEIKKNILAVNYEYFKDFDFYYMKRAVDKYICEKNNAPTIAELIRQYKIARTLFEKKDDTKEETEEISDEEFIEMVKNNFGEDDS